MQPCLHAFYVCFPHRPTHTLEQSDFLVSAAESADSDAWLAGETSTTHKTSPPSLHRKTGLCATPIPSASSTRSNSSFVWGGDIFIHCCLLCYTSCLEGSVQGLSSWWTTHLCKVLPGLHLPHRFLLTEHLQQSKHQHRTNSHEGTKVMHLNTVEKCGQKTTEGVTMGHSVKREITLLPVFFQKMPIPNWLMRTQQWVPGLCHSRPVCTLSH